MDRLDARTGCFFAIGLLAMTFGCHGAHFGGLGHIGHVGGAGHVGGIGHVGGTGHVGGSVASVGVAAARSGVAVARVVDSAGRGVAIANVAQSRSEVLDEGADRVAASCPYVCPADSDGRLIYVCARQALVVDFMSSQPHPAFVCDPPSSFTP